jgi:hypothetical protein
MASGMNDNEKDIAAVFRETALAKQRAADHRFKPRPEGLEAPRDVYLAACASVAEAIGYRFSKTGPTATKQAGRTRFRFFFQSDRNNVAGLHVRMLVHGMVENAEFKRWQAETAWPLQATGVILSGQIGNFQTLPDWMSWEISDPSTRETRIGDLVDQIRRLAFPLFERCLDLDAFAHDLVRGPVAGVYETYAVGLCAWRLGPKAAEACLDKSLDGYADLRRGFGEERDRLMSGGAPSPFRSPPGDFAQIAVAYGIGADL